MQAMALLCLKLSIIFVGNVNQDKEVCQMPERRVDSLLYYFLGIALLSSFIEVSKQNPVQYVYVSTVF